HFQLEVLAVAPEGTGGDPAFVTRTTQDALGNLYDALVAPLAGRLPDAGQLYIVPHRFLHAVPFECLWDGRDYIDERYTLRRCPTAEFLLRPRRRASRKSGDRVGEAAQAVLVAGIVTGGPASVEAEIEAVAGQFPRRAVRLLRDPTSAELLGALGDAQLVHLSTHGVFREDNPLLSRLRTADGAIFLADVLDRRLTADVVVLSACSSGQVFTGAGDDLSGVAHGFLAAGARRLVASLWRVHDAATRQLMERFYIHYRRGEAAGDPAEALRMAGRELRAQWPHPFFWGSFCTFGE
ncbi:MAG: CHAT domain-containing protein, partial [Candidatus Eisenbacteria bacterium]|nr:CHAT domain-containing protein [Candidatus Eisenbacteria bacterium]